MVLSITITLFVMLMTCVQDTATHNMFPFRGFQGPMMSAPHPMPHHPAMLGPGHRPGPAFPPLHLKRRPLLISLPTSHASRKRMFLLRRPYPRQHGMTGFGGPQGSPRQQNFASRQQQAQFRQGLGNRRYAPQGRMPTGPVVDPRGSFSGHFEGMAGRLNVGGGRRGSRDGGRIIDLRNAFNSGRIGPMREFNRNKILSRSPIVRQQTSNNRVRQPMPGRSQGAQVSVVTRSQGGPTVDIRPLVVDSTGRYRPRFGSMRGSTIDLSGTRVVVNPGPGVFNNDRNVLPQAGVARGMQFVSVENKPAAIINSGTAPIVPVQTEAAVAAASAAAAAAAAEAEVNANTVRQELGPINSQAMNLSPDLVMILKEALAGTGVDIQALTTKLNGSTGSGIIDLNSLLTGETGGTSLSDDLVSVLGHDLAYALAGVLGNENPSGTEVLTVDAKTFDRALQQAQRLNSDQSLTAALQSSNFGGGTAQDLNLGDLQIIVLDNADLHRLQLEGLDLNQLTENVIGSSPDQIREIPNIARATDVIGPSSLARGEDSVVIQDSVGTVGKPAGTVSMAATSQDAIGVFSFPDGEFPNIHASVSAIPEHVRKMLRSPLASKSRHLHV